MPTFDLLEIHTFGQVVINWRLRAQPLRLSPREAALLIYLAYQRVPIARAHLCTLFWPNDAPQRAAGNLRKLLLDTRRSLGEGVVTDREHVGLHKNLDFWLDVHEFQWQMQPLAQIGKGSGEVKEIDLPRLQQGVKLYQGEFLANFKQPKSRLFGQWVEQEQQGLQQQVTTALKVLREKSQAKEQYTEAIDYATRQLMLDPFDEESNDAMMRLWAHSGHIEEALQHYHAYCQLLKKELDSEPEPQMALLYQQIRTGLLPGAAQMEGAFSWNHKRERVATPRSSGAQWAWSRHDPNLELHPRLPHFTPERGTKPAQLLGNAGISPKPIPKPLTPLIGRAALRPSLEGYLTDPTIRLITLVGMGGVGKTHAVLTWAEQWLNHFNDGIVFVPLENELGQKGRMERLKQEKEWDKLLLATTKALHMASDATPAPTEQLLVYLRDKQLLLIFDGYEQIAEGAAFLTQLLQAAPLLKLLITTRECLQLTGETVIRLEGLQLPPLENMPALTNTLTAEQAGTTVSNTDRTGLAQQAPSLELLLTGIQRQNLGLVWQPGSLRLLKQICHLVGGIPLAIELAAELFTHYSAQEIVDHLQNDFTLLSTVGSSRAQRHQSITRVLVDAWDRLSVQEQTLLARLTIFDDRFSRHAVLAITGGAYETLVALVNKSLVRSQGAGFYELPRLVRLFASRQLATLDHEKGKTQLQAAHADYYLTYLQQFYQGSMDQQELVRDLLEQELGNLLNSCAWIHHHGSAQQRQQCAALLATVRQWSATAALR